jgi:NitT/TauT family transport system substrate-binding protein
VRASVLERQPGSVLALLRGWFGAIDYIEADPADAARRMGVRQQTSGEQFLQAQQGLHIPSRGENLKMLGGASPDLLVAGRRLMTLMVEAKLLRAPVDIDQVLAPRPLEDLLR